MHAPKTLLIVIFSLGLSAHASGESFAQALNTVEKRWDALLNPCPKDHPELGRQLIEFNIFFENFLDRSSAKELSELRASQRRGQELLRFLKPYHIPATYPFRHVDQACGIHSVDFFAALKDQDFEKTKVRLGEWLICVESHYHRIPSVLHKISACFQALSNSVSGAD